METDDQFEPCLGGCFEEQAEIAAARAVELAESHAKAIAAHDADTAPRFQHEAVSTADTISQDAEVKPVKAKKPASPSSSDADTE